MRGAQLTLAVLALVSYTLVSTQLQPYIKYTDDLLWTACLSSLFLALYIGQLILLDAWPFPVAVLSFMLRSTATAPVLMLVSTVVYELHKDKLWPFRETKRAATKKKPRKVRKYMVASELSDDSKGPAAGEARSSLHTIAPALASKAVVAETQGGGGTEESAQVELGRTHAAGNDTPAVAMETKGESKQEEAAVTVGTVQIAVDGDPRVTSLR